jgi:hypothetical protein
VARSSIRSAHRAPDTPLSIGAHGWRHRWIVNGSAGLLVALELTPPARARTMPFPLRVRELKVSVGDPDELIATLGRDRVASPG